MLYIISIGLDVGGIILILMGVFLSLGPPVFKLHVVGREPIEIRGKRFEELIRIARQYREETTVSEKETP